MYDFDRSNVTHHITTAIFYYQTFIQIDNFDRSNITVVYALLASDADDSKTSRPLAVNTEWKFQHCSHSKSTSIQTQMTD